MNRQRKSPKVWVVHMVPAILVAAISLAPVAVAQQPEPTVLSPGLSVRKFVSGLTTPTTIAFIDEDDILVLENGFVYLYWTESSTGTVNGDPPGVPLLGNRVDRFVWNGSMLTFDKNLIRLRAFQADEGQPLRGNHNGGRIVFEAKEKADERADKDQENENGTKKRKLFILIGDNGRRGWMQNVTIGTFRDGIHDDQFGGPAPDNAHL